MSRSRISFEDAAARLRGGSLVAVMGVAMLLAVPAAPGAAQAHLTQDEALRLAFPEPAVIERRTAFLSEDDLARARAAAGRDVPIRGGVVTYYVGSQGGAFLGAAYFDRHRVRTLDEVVMIVVSPEGRIAHLEVLRFAEPPEYAASRRWLSQLEDRELEDALSLRGSVINLTGATLTAHAVVRASRRVLALHQVIAPFQTR